MKPSWQVSTYRQQYSDTSRPSPHCFSVADTLRLLQAGRKQLLEQPAGNKVRSQVGAACGAGS